MASSRLIDWAERGLVPDALVRLGIRRLLAARLAAIGAGGCEARQERLEALLAVMERSPLAVLPEKANEQHYEVPAAFFREVLGPRLKYSSAFFPPGVGDLGAAEDAMLALTAQRAELAPGQRILELGCGWGSLSLWMAQNLPGCRILAVSNSASQRRFIEERRDSLGLDGLEVVTADVNHFEPDETFDRVVSVEMFEHVRNWQSLFGRIAGWLVPGGKLFVHVFCHREVPYLFETEGAGNWMGRFFFSGGLMPSDGLPLRFQRDLTAERHWRVDGRHYARTSTAWLSNLDRGKRTILPMLAETYGASEARRWFGRWRLFFLACEQLFGYRGGQEWWVAHHRFVRRA